MEDILSKISGFITADNIALLSVIITVLIFVASRHEELKYKKHDDKKVQYLKLINWLSLIRVQRYEKDYFNHKKGE